MSTDGYPANSGSNADLPDAPATESGMPPNNPRGADATADAPGGVEGDAAGQNADPDLITDEDLEKDDA